MNRYTEVQHDTNLVLIKILTTALYTEMLHNKLTYIENHPSQEESLELDEGRSSCC